MRISQKKPAFFVIIATFMLCLTVGSALAAFPQPENVVEYWDFDSDATGTKGFCDGTVTNAAHDSSDYILGGGSYSFDGTGDHIALCTSLSPEDNDWSISAWFQTSDSGTERYIVAGAGTGVTDWFNIRQKPTNDINFIVDDGSNPLTDMGTGSYNDGAWHHVVMTRTASNDTWTFYVDGTQTATSTNTDSAVSLNVDIWVGDWSGYAGSWNGNIDEIAWYNVSLSPSEVSDLYNSGSGQPFPTEGSASTNTHTVNVKNLYNDSNNEGVNVTIWNGTAFHSKLTDNSGNAIFYNVSITTITANLSKTGYFANATNIEIPVNGTGYGGVYEGVFNVTSITRLVDGATLGASLGVWTVNTSGGKTYDECGITYPCNIYLKNGTNQLTLQYTGMADYYPLSFQVNITAPEEKAGTVAGVYDALATITAVDATTGSVISNFTLNVSNTTEGYADSFETTTGSLLLPAVQGIGEFLLIDADGYAYANFTLNASNSTPSYQFSLFTQNSVQFYIYDEYLGGLITQNVILSLVKNETELEYSTTNGSVYADLLDPGTWTVTFSSAGYDERVYFVTVASKSHQTLNAYLLNSSLSQPTTFSIKTADGDYIIGETLTMQDYVNGSWVTIAQKETDFFGQAYFPLQYAHEYKLIIEADGYVTKTATFERVSTSYSITLTSSNTQGYVPIAEEFTYSIAPSSATTNSTNFTLSTSSPDGRLEWFYIKVTLNGTDYVQNVTGSPSGGTAQVTLNLSGYSGYTVTGTYKILSTGLDAPYVVTSSYYIYGMTPGNYTFAGFMEHYDAELSATTKAVSVTSVALIMGVSLAFLALEAGLLVASLILILGSWFGWLHWTYTVIVVGALWGSMLWGRR
jgi:hypothetical protein